MNSSNANPIRSLLRATALHSVTVALMATPLMANADFTKSGPGQLLTAKEELASPSKSVRRKESIKKIVSLPEAENESDEVAPVRTAGTVTSEPAPGLSTSSAAEPIVVQSTPAAPVEPTVATTPEPSSTSVTPIAAPSIAATPSPSPTPKPVAKPVGGGVSAEQSLRWLTNGNNRYVKRSFRKDGRSQKDRTRLLTSQKPHAVILSCSDSRVPPEILFDQTLGEVAVVRVLGGALDSSTIASVEHAVGQLGTRLLVVLAHTRCETIEAALKMKEGETSGSEAMDKLLADIRPRLSSLADQARTPHLEVEATVNADGIARDLVKRSALLKEKVELGELVIKPALYRMENGKVSFY